MADSAFLDELKIASDEVTAVAHIIDHCNGSIGCGRIDCECCNNERSGIFGILEAALRHCLELLNAHGKGIENYGIVLIACGGNCLIDSSSGLAFN